MRRASPLTLVLSAVLCCALLVAPGCIVGSPMAAVSGEPYGMTADDIGALRGKKRRIWSDAPVFAALDLPFAFVLDTGFLPIAVIVWALKAAFGGDDHDEGEAHSH